MQIVFLGSDHAGFLLKQSLLSQLTAAYPDVKFVDCGTHGTASVDYPDFACIVAKKVIAESARGILVCGSGIGVAMTANRFSGIRAAQVWDETSARLCRQHNDSNILCLGERLIGPEVAWAATQVWMTTEFLGGRHARRVQLIEQFDKA